MTPKGGWLNYGEVKEDYIILRGSVPGPKKRLIMMRKGLRAKSHEKESLELKEVILDSQQGA
ncbi:MAG: 50S ribosomal protein L3 [Deltaproteobacteria bacterium]|nr:50S ribosomal protein L3 [Deltaproteobacteria bacterium]